MGLENLARFLEPYAAHATLFMVGSDLLVPNNQPAVRAVAAAGHVAVSNRDLLGFLLTPGGLLYSGLLGTFAVALLLPVFSLSKPGH